MAVSEITIGLLVGGVLFVLYLLYRYAYAPYQVLKNCGIKGPTPIPFLGNYLERTKMSIMKHDQFLSDKYGPISGFYIGPQPFVVISDLEMLKQIMVKDFDNFSDHIPNVDFLIDNSGSGGKDVFSAKGESWRTARRTISPSFSASKMKMMMPLLKKSTDNLVAVFSEKVTSEKSFEVLKVFTSFTLETILSTAFGRQVDIQRGESDELSKVIDALLPFFTSGRIETLTLFHSNFPWIATLLYYAFAYSEAGKAFSDLKKVALSLIKARRETGQTEKYKDILQLMIEATGSEDGEAGEGKESAIPAGCPAHKATMKGTMTDEEVVENIVTFFVAGNETTANTLSFASYLLALHPDIQEKLQSEIDNYFDDNPDSTLYMATQEITYLDNVIQETLRLYPPGPETDRYSTRTTTVNGVVIPKGAFIIVPISVLHNNPLYWENPGQFDPERFTAEERAKRPQMSHMPFGFGPRICIGMRLALLEAKMALIELLKRYTFMKTPETEVPLQTDFSTTLKPKNGIYLKVVNRV